MGRNERTLAAGAALLILAAVGFVLLRHHGHGGLNAMVGPRAFLGPRIIRAVAFGGGGWSVTARDVVAIVSWALGLVGTIVTLSGLIDRWRAPRPV